MSWRAMLIPNRIVGQATKWFCYVLALLLGAHLIAQIPFLGIALVVCLAAYIAHSVRNRPTGPTRARNIGRAERTPIMPIMEDDE